MPSNPFQNFDKYSGLANKWISVPSELESLDGTKKEIKIELMEDGLPRAMAFFDIDGTLAHLAMIHGRAIQEIFKDADPKELEETYYRGFKLGNSFREFDRMLGIYVDGHISWKDPEVYFRERFLPNEKEIDEPGNPAHRVAALILEEYGKAAARIADELYKKNPEEFQKSNIEPVIFLAKMFSSLGIPMVGFTANAKVFVDKLSKYLKLSDLFLDIATDENIAGGGKETAIHHLIKRMESKGVPVPQGRLLFVGDSLRGDIGSSLVARNKNQDLVGQGILVLKSKQELIEIKKQISADPGLKMITDSMHTYGFIVDQVPLDQDGKPMLLFRFYDEFLEKL